MVAKEWARLTATSQRWQPVTGDQRRAVSGPASRVPEGSNSQVLPRKLLTLEDQAIMSVLVDVVTTAPGAVNKLGTTTADVLPERGGPMTSRACWRPANSGSPSGVMARPKKKPCQVGGDGAIFTTSVPLVITKYPR